MNRRPEGEGGKVRWVTDWAGWMRGIGALCEVLLGGGRDGVLPAHELLRRAPRQRHDELRLHERQRLAARVEVLFPREEQNRCVRLACGRKKRAVSTERGASGRVCAGVYQSTSVLRSAAMSEG